jgi:ribulose-phosphate 3-epimerase
MPTICPAILAGNEEEYRQQIEKIAHFAQRIQIDLTDGQFAASHTVKPEQAWWPVGFRADFHLMYRHPMPAVQTIIEHRPNLIIVHAEAEGNFEDVASFCHSHEVKVGVALLQQTSTEAILPALSNIDHVLIFSGNLGYQGGGHANLKLLSKLSILKQHKPSLEVGWDGGINDQNVAELVSGGVDVLNVGGYIQKAEDPARAFAALQRIADETGTT